MKIRAKFGLFTGLVALTAVAAVSALAFLLQRRLILEHMEQSRAERSASFAAACRQSLAGENELLMVNFARLLSESPGIAYAYFADLDGIEEIAPRVKNLRFTILGGKTMEFHAGQFVQIFIPQPEKCEREKLHREGFEPSKGEARQIYSLVHLTALPPVLKGIGPGGAYLSIPGRRLAMSGGGGWPPFDSPRGPPYNGAAEQKEVL